MQRNAAPGWGFALVLAPAAWRLAGGAGLPWAAFFSVSATPAGARSCGSRMRWRQSGEGQDVELIRRGGEPAAGV